MTQSVPARPCTVPQQETKWPTAHSEAGPTSGSPVSR